MFENVPFVSRSVCVVSDAFIPTPPGGNYTFILHFFYLWRTPAHMAGGSPPAAQEEDLSFRCEALRVQLDSFATATEAIGAAAREGNRGSERWVGVGGWLVGWFMVQLPRGHICWYSW